MSKIGCALIPPCHSNYETQEESPSDSDYENEEETLSNSNSNSFKTFTR